MSNTEDHRKLERLSEPFAPSEIHFKPQIVKNDRALAMAYIDARSVQDRLDDILGGENWQDSYTLVPDGSVICRLRIRLNGHWISKMDVGSPSEQPDRGDRLKAAFSDALKRAAVKFGIGRYLYRLPAQWVDYDSTKKQFVRTPELPSWAIPNLTTASDDRVGRYEMQLTRCESRPELDIVCQEIAKALAQGMLSPADRTALRKTAEECKRRLPVESSNQHTESVGETASQPRRPSTPKSNAA